MPHEVGDLEQPVLVRADLVRSDVGRRRDVLDAGRGAQPGGVEDRDPDDLAEPEGDDGQVVTAHPQCRRAQDHAEDHRDTDRDRNHQQERPARVLGGQDPRRVGAGGVEPDVAEVEQPGVPDHDVQADCDQGVGGHGRQHAPEVGVRGRHQRRLQDGEGVGQDDAAHDHDQPRRPRTQPRKLDPRRRREPTTPRGRLRGAHARALARDSPRMPVGRTSRITIRSTKATTSCHWGPNNADPQF